MSGATQSDRDKALADLKKQDPTKQYSDEDVNKQVYNNFYNQAFTESRFGTGGKVQQAIQAATAAVQGLAGGDLAKAIAGGSAPYIASVIGNSGFDDTGKVLAHAAVNAALAAAKGNSALVGATGAATAELTGMIAVNAYGKPVSELSETEKQTVSALATLAAGLAGGLAGDSAADVVAGAQAGKTTVESNYLSSKEARQLDKEMQDCKASGGDCGKVAEKYIEISNKNSKELVEACTGGGVACVTWQELIQGATNVANDAHPSQIRLDEKLKDPSAAALVNYLNGTDLKFLEDNITTGDRVLSVISDPTSWPVAIMSGKAIITNAVNNTKEQLIAVGVSTGLGAGIQYGTTGEVKLSDVIGMGVISAVTAGKGYNPTVTWNAAGGYYQAEISGDDPFMAALVSKAGASAGYAVGNVIKVPMDKVLNPVSKQYEWVPTGVWTITRPAPQTSVPSIMGNLGDTFVSGLTGDVLQKTISGDKNETK
ncbi:hypothetical protein EHW65_10730 [Erwinia psidii]|uniref:VENN motif-containing domain-containing protein n=2 Tax=Erwinia psidii TaxID=69224 RepID=A0A3N6SPI4_9GAMM|nr:hypothetical protein [Erwinia psidii]RQM39726.1 hypothetical protein EB241_03230 [Erwinia psidii]